MSRNMKRESIIERNELRDLSLAELEFPKVLQRVARYCVTESAAEHIAALLPTPDISALHLDLDAVQELVDILMSGEDVPLASLSDTHNEFKKLGVEGAFLQPDELLRVKDVLFTARRVEAFVGGREDCDALQSITEHLYVNRLLEKHIHDTVDEHGAIKDTASRELGNIRRNIINTSARLRGRLQKMLKKVSDESLSQDEYITQREGRFVLPMKAENKRSIPGIIHGVSQSGQTVFVEPAETYELNNELSLLYSEERREIERILRVLTEELRADRVRVQATQQVLVHCDSLRARALYANNIGGIKPTIVGDDGEIELTSVKHPLLLEKAEQEVVPLSIRFDSEKLGHLISGPNAGGKTVALKCIGLSVAMALSGVFPSGMLVTPYRDVYTSIGDHQSIENDLSTFSSQIARLRDVLQCAGPDSLVLVDEICSGTDPQEGAALSVGIMESLLTRRSGFVVTTHQSALKSYGLTREGISNASMEFDAEKLQPTYRFLEGVPGNSYAFYLAESMGISTTVMKVAREYLGDSHQSLEQSIEVIQRHRQAIEQEFEAARKAQRMAEQAQKQYEEKFSAFRIKYKELMRVAREEAAEVVDNANKLVENTIREVREDKKPPGEIKKAFDAERASLRKQASAKKKEQRTEQVTYKAGDAVVLEGFNTVGEVLSLDEDGKHAVVEFDSVKFRTETSQLQKSAKTSKKKPRRTQEDFVIGDANSRLDVRGQYPQDAELEVENRIAESLMSNTHELTVVHGKGTGALRKAIHSLLRQHPAVQHYREGELNEGGAGVTIVTLR